MSNKKKLYNVAFIGFGGMASNHCKQLKKGNVRAVSYGAWDIDPVRLNAAAEQGLKVYSSQDELLSDPKVDIVVVAVFNTKHREITIAALEAGKHVICEKPATVHPWELEEMMACAARTGNVLTIDQNRRVNRDFVLLKRQLESGIIGQPYLIESRVEGSRGIPKGWRTDYELGGGMMLDWGVHLIDQLMYLDKTKVTSVFCKMFYINYNVDDFFHLVMTFEDGLTAIIEVGTNSFIKHPRWLAYGKDGTVEITNWNCDGRVVRCKEREDTWSSEIKATIAGPSKTMAERSPDSVEITELQAPTDVNDSLDPTYIQLIDAIEGTHELTIKPEEALRVIKVMRAAFESSEKNAVVAVDI